MNYDDIFNQSTQQREWFLFKNVGDQIAGTFVDLTSGTDGFNNEQWIVTLERDGKQINVGIRKNHPVLVKQFEGVKFGQIIGLKYEADKDTQRGTAKLINLKANPDMVDEGWIEKRVKAQEIYGLSRSEALTPNWGDTPAEEPVAMAPTARVVSPEAAQSAPAVPETDATDLNQDSIDTIKTLLVNKNILDESSPNEEIAAKVKEVCGLDMTTENYAEIINKVAVLQS